MLRKTMLIALCAASLGAVSWPQPRAAAAVVYFDSAPPARRVEVVPAPRRGYVWVPGYWDARGHRHVWARGHWVHARHGYHYVHPRWVRHHHRWYIERGR